MELRECPFCGASVDWCECGSCHQIQCKGCGAQIDNTKLGLIAETLEKCRLEFAAWWNRRASPASVPEGWKLVPVEPTIEMVEEGNNGFRSAEPKRHTVSGCYKSMIATAPTPPVSEDRKDADRLNYLQEHGATVHLVSTTNSNLLSFVIGGLHRSKRLNLREAIDAAMQEDKP